MKSKSTINLKGLDYKQILAMPYSEIKKLSRSDLSKLVSRAVSALNKRWRRVSEHTAKTNYESASVEHLRSRIQEGMKGPFSVKKKSREQLIEEFYLMKRFDEAKTSTVEGTIDFYKQFKDIIDSVDDNLKDKFWQVFRDIYKGNKSAIQAGVFGSEDIIRLSYRATSSNPAETVDDMKAKVEEALHRFYEGKTDDEEEDVEEDADEQDSFRDSYF